MNQLVYSIVFLFLLSSCVDNQPEEIDEGVEVSGSAVLRVEAIASGNKTYEDIRTGEYAETFQDQLIDGRDRYPLWTLGIEVDNYEKTETDHEFTILVQTKDVSGDIPREYLKEQLIKQPIQSSVSTSSKGSPIPPRESQVERSFFHQDIRRALETKGLRISKYFNLSSKRSTEAPPRQVRESADCRGLDPCQLDITNISYEIEVLDNYGRIHRLKIIKKVASNLPYLASTVSFCQEFGVRINLGTEEKPQRRLVKVRECSDLQDFRFGKK